MLNLRNVIVCILALAAVAGTCFGQDAEPAKFYKLDFVVKEVEAGKVLNARSYSVTASLTSGSSIRTGSKVPVLATGPGTSGQFNYLDVGVNIDCHPMKEAQNGLFLGVNADISSVLQESAAPAGPPVVRQNKWTSNVLVPLKKPTVIFSSDDLTSKHQMQVELTATPIT